MKSPLYDSFAGIAAHYLSAWDQWIVSDYCFLSEKEILITSIYLREKSITKVAIQINRSRLGVSQRIRQIRAKLVCGLPIYFKWEKTKLNDEQYPLNVPIACLKIPVKLKIKLAEIGATLAEILKVNSVEDFLKLRGFGKGRLSDLHTFLDTYGYAYLLKNDESLGKNITCISLSRTINGEELLLTDKYPKSPPIEFQRNDFSIQTLVKKKSNQ